jgi:transposase
MTGHLFILRNGSSERVKILWWDWGGYALYYTRLERWTFQFPAIGEEAVAKHANKNLAQSTLVTVPLTVIKSNQPGQLRQLHQRWRRTGDLHE